MAKDLTITDLKQIVNQLNNHLRQLNTQGGTLAGLFDALSTRIARFPNELDQITQAFDALLKTSEALRQAEQDQSPQRQLLLAHAQAAHDQAVAQAQALAGKGQGGSLDQLLKALTTPILTPPPIQDAGVNQLLEQLAERVGKFPQELDKVNAAFNSLIDTTRLLQKAEKDAQKNATSENRAILKLAQLAQARAVKDAEKVATPEPKPKKPDVFGRLLDQLAPKSTQGPFGSILDAFKKAAGGDIGGSIRQVFSSLRESTTTVLQHTGRSLSGSQPGTGVSQVGQAGQAAQAGRGAASLGAEAGAGAAAGEGAAAGAGEGLGAAAPALANPYVAAVAAVVALVAAVPLLIAGTIKLGMYFEGLGKNVLDASAHLADFSGSMAIVHANREIFETFQNIRVGEATAGSTGQVEQSYERLSTALEPIRVVLTNIYNTVLSVLMDAVTTLVDVARSAINFIIDQLNVTITGINAIIVLINVWFNAGLATLRSIERLQARDREGESTDLATWLQELRTRGDTLPQFRP